MSGPSQDGTGRLPVDPGVQEKELLLEVFEAFPNKFVCDLLARKVVAIEQVAKDLPTVRVEVEASSNVSRLAAT